jgi:hypothetical protein
MSTTVPPPPPPIAGGPPPPPPPPFVPTGTGPPGPPPSGGRSTALIVIGVIVVFAIIAGTIIGVVALTRDNSSDDDSATGEIFLEGASSEGTNPFGSLPGPAVSITTTSSTQTTMSTTPGSASARSVSGGQRGLYGGSLTTGRCDPEAQIQFLSNNRSIANAFVNALNTDPTLRWSGGTKVSREQISAYIRELTSVTLVSDTRVTNYGYSNNRATPRQSVLQAGTAVMVDRYGTPRIKCNCGNPLTAPVAIRTTPTYTGTQWPGFSPSNIVVVTQTTVIIDVFILVNLNGTGFIERTPGSTGIDVAPTTSTTAPPTTAPPSTAPPATRPPTTSPGGTVLGTGDVQATLNWSGDCDLDLHVVDPLGVEIFFLNSTSPSGGQLDVDDIPDPGATGNHVENVFWPTGGAPRGTYNSFVVNLGGYSSTTCPYTLNVFVNGIRAGGNTGVLGSGDTSPTASVIF